VWFFVKEVFVKKYKALIFGGSLLLGMPSVSISQISCADITYVVRRSDGSPFLTGGWSMNWELGWEQWSAVNLEEKVISHFLKEFNLTEVKQLEGKPFVFHYSEGRRPDYRTIEIQLNCPPKALELCAKVFSEFWCDQTQTKSVPFENVQNIGKFVLKKSYDPRSQTQGYSKTVVILDAITQERIIQISAGEQFYDDKNGTWTSYLQ